MLNYENKMMTFVGHIGLALIIAYLFKLNPLLVVIGGILPDMDIILTLFFPFGKVHRKLTHSFLFLGIFIILSFFYPLLFPVLIGIITHYIGDFDRWGLPLFWPFTNKHFSFVKISHKNDCKSAQEGLLRWFVHRDIWFWVEWFLLIIGIILVMF